MTHRPATLVTMTVAVAVMAGTMSPNALPSLIWNAFESAPIGLYHGQPLRQLTVITLAVAYPPEPLATYLADSGYLPRGVPLIKHVLALPGQTVCCIGLTITGRWNRRGHRPRARSPRTPAPGLAGMPRSRRR